MQVHKYYFRCLILNTFLGPLCSVNNLEQPTPNSLSEEDNDPLESMLKPLSADDEELDDSQLLELDPYQGDNQDALRVKKSSREALRKWAIDYNISHQALKGLLSVIKDQYGDVDLPSDPRTLLITPQNTSMLVKAIPGGTYWHQGLEVCLRNRFKFISSDISIELNVNMDGIPIHKSSKDQFWPILCNVYDMPHIKPMVVGIFLGKSKPLDVNEYLSPFIDELIPILDNGLVVNGHFIRLKIRCFICDSPARAFVKGNLGFFLHYVHDSVAQPGVALRFTPSEPRFTYFPYRTFFFFEMAVSFGSETFYK